ncbi:hypothetical protein [Ferribacterium limneticum]|uniref:hypothetical protein n=1 Tax=Ferribacterium limneticum TaxID=76259 RepID=UPI001CF90635|nr:hypothetical protein [Ferribacterium limneticum]UCV26766.1 hypothetical protein KI617_10635 [Ferribacterium limneticum]UCV30683.1 hypothetical protein KI608_10635 [Ferribacterium limneticum]
MKSAISKIQDAITKGAKPMFRTYAPLEDGVCWRVGRTYRSIEAAIRVATTMSNSRDWVEIRDDSKPLAKRLIAIARKGMLLNDVVICEASEVLQ